MGQNKVMRPNFRLIAANAGASRVHGYPATPRVALSDREDAWQATVKQRLEELIRLDEGWDGYTAFPVSFDNAMFTFEMLKSICRFDTNAPQIVPGPSGDLQVEWHTHGGDIELWVGGPYKVHAWRSLPDGMSEEVELTSDFSIVSQWLNQLTEPTIAFAAAA